MGKKRSKATIRKCLMRMTEFNKDKEAAKRFIEDQKNNNIKVTLNMESNTKITKVLDHGYSINTSASGIKALNHEDTTRSHATRKRKKLSRKRLEKLLLDKSDQLIQAHGEIDKLQSSCHQLKTEVKDWKEKSDSLARTCTKLAKKLKSDLELNGQPSKDIKNVNDNKDIIKKRKVSDDDDKREDRKKSKLEENLVTLKPKIGKEILDQTVVAVNPIIPELPNQVDPNLSRLLKPNLSLNKTDKGLEVLWEFEKSFDEKLLKCYELFTYKSGNKPGVAWKKLTNIDSMKLPIKVTLSDFKSGSSYFFAVRPVAVAENKSLEYGPFSDIQKISL